MPIDLSPKTLAIIDELVAAGYGSPEAIVSQAVDELRNQFQGADHPDAEGLKALVLEALDDPGPDLSSADVDASIARVLDELRAEGIPE